MAIRELANEITKHIYRAYGTDSGMLFGIRADQRQVVELIVQATLDYNEVTRNRLILFQTTLGFSKKKEEKDNGNRMD